MTHAARKVYDRELLGLYSCSFAILLSQVLEEEHKATEEERGDNEEDEIFRVLKGENEILIDQQGSLREETKEVIWFVIFMRGV